VSSLGDHRIFTCRALIEIAQRGLGRDIFLQDFARDDREGMLRSQQLRITAAEFFFRLLPHIANLAVKICPRKVWDQTLSQGPDTDAAFGKLLPFRLVEELEERAADGQLGNAEIEIGNDSGPGCYFGRQEFGSADERIDQRTLTGIHLPDEGDVAMLTFDHRQQAGDIAGNARIAQGRKLLAGSEHGLARLAQLVAHADLFRRGAMRVAPGPDMDLAGRIVALVGKHACKNRRVRIARINACHIAITGKLDFDGAAMALGLAPARENGTDNLHYSPGHDFNDPADQ
jgi:hypothetical protein